MGDFAVCDHCGMPDVMHGGFNHATGKCLMLNDLIGLSLRHGEKKARELIPQLNEWFAARDAAEQAALGWYQI